jgi:hypothetical protein
MCGIKLGERPVTSGDPDESSKEANQYRHSFEPLSVLFAQLVRDDESAG